LAHLHSRVCVWPHSLRRGGGMNAIALAFLVSIFAVFLAFYYFAVVVQAASYAPQEQSLLCAVAGVGDAAAVGRAGPCVYNGTYIIYLSP